MIDLKSTMDEDGYPTEETERLVREFEGDARELLASLREVWMHPTYWDEEDGVDILDRPVHRYHVSTAGWSGNESLIDALRNHWIFWMRFWVEERVGGHFIFEISEGDATVIKTDHKPCATCGRY
jgi:hypothetical protein